MNLINRSISHLGVEQVIELFTTVKANIENPDNASVFTNHTAIVAAITGVLTPLTAAHNAVLQNNDLAKSLTNAQQEALVTCGPVAADVADYGETCAAGDPAKAQLLGMPMRKTDPPMPMTKPSGFAVTTGDATGELDWTCDSICGAHNYEAQVSPDPFTESSFVLKATSTKSKGIIPGLASGTKVWVRIHAVGGHNAVGPWSDPLCRVVP
jgi:hypothetical protein